MNVELKTGAVGLGLFRKMSLNTPSEAQRRAEDGGPIWGSGKGTPASPPSWALGSWPAFRFLRDPGQFTPDSGLSVLICLVG